MVVEVEPVVVEVVTNELYTSAVLRLWQIVVTVALAAQMLEALDRLREGVTTVQ